MQFLQANRLDEVEAAGHYPNAVDSSAQLKKLR